MWHGTHADATWHARPRGRATRVHADAWVAPTWREKWLGWQLMGDESFLCVVKTQIRWSNKIYKTELTKTR